MSKKILPFVLFNEANLNITDLSKSVKGDLRGDVLVNKLISKGTLIDGENNKPIEVDSMSDGKGDWVDPKTGVKQITKSGEYDKEKAILYFKKSKSPNSKYKDVFMDEDGEKYPLNKIKKTKEFGSSGPGNRTKEFESLQGVFLAIRQGIYLSGGYSGDESNKVLTSRNIRSLYETYIKKSSKLLHLPEDLKLSNDLIVNYISDDDWVGTFARIPNKLWNDKYLDPNKVYSIYHNGYKGSDSPFIAIKSKFNSLFKNEDVSYKVPIDKFCPADFYLSSFVDNKMILSEIKESLSIQDLVDRMNNLFDRKILIPISLKKLKKITEKLPDDTTIKKFKFNIITNNEDGYPVIDFELSKNCDKTPGASILTCIDPFMGISSSLRADILWRKEVKSFRIMGFDTSNRSTLQDISGEVEGSSSRHGKVSLNYIKHIIDKYSNDTITQVESKTSLGKLSISKLRQKCKQLHNSFKSYSKKDPEIFDFKEVNSRHKEIENDKNGLISKIQSLQVVLALYEINLLNYDKGCKAIGSIFKYALSIENDSFICPRYLRII